MPAVSEETAVEKFAALGVRGILWQLARDGQIVDVRCEMPQCYCFRGRRHVEPRGPHSDWEPTADHYPRLKMHGGHRTSDNVRLAHRLCNRRDYEWRTRINAMLAKRLSLEDIADELNGMKVPTIHGTNRWTAASVRKAFVSYTSPTTTSPATTSPTTTSPAPSVLTYTGSAFSIDYPSSWIIESAEQQHSYGTDTTIVSPTDSNTLLRVDVNATSTITDPRVAAQPVINTVSQAPGYHLIDLTRGTFEGFPALHWEFVADSNGVLVHEEDEFFIDAYNGDSVAVLTEAPAAQYPSDATAFAQLRQTLAMN